MRVWKALPKFDGRAALGTWIYAIARNTCLMEIRRRRPVVSMDDPDSAVAAAVEIATATPPAADPERDNLLRMVDRLPANQQQAVRLFYLEDRSYETVAELMGMPLGTVKNLLTVRASSSCSKPAPRRSWPHERLRLPRHRTLCRLRIRDRGVARWRAVARTRAHHLVARRHLRPLPRVARELRGDRRAAGGVAAAARVECGFCGASRGLDRQPLEARQQRARGDRARIPRVARAFASWVAPAGGAQRTRRGRGRVLRARAAALAGVQLPTLEPVDGSRVVFFASQGLAAIALVAGLAWSRANSAGGWFRSWR